VGFLFNRTSAILFAFTAGALVPQAHGFAPLIRWLIMAMLFLVFLQVRFTRSSLRASHAWLFAANVLMGFGAYGLGWLLGGRDLALALFFAGITPTATAAPVVVSFLRGRVDYVVAAFLLTNLGIAALLPLLLPLVIGRETPGLLARVAGSVLLVVFLPMGLALLLRTLYPASTQWPGKLRNLSFGLWLTAMFLIMANASHFVRAQATLPLSTFAFLALGSILVCCLNFLLGRLIGGGEFPREASQSLGQKNTAFTIYLAMTYASPLIALGPTFYVIWHNLWNSYQLHRARKAQP